MKTLFILFVYLFFVAGIPNAAAAVSSTVNYQGRITNAAGVPLSGNKVMNVKVYDAATAGNLLYSELLGNVIVDANGIYGFQFGAQGNGGQPTLSGALGSAAEHWLELTVDGVTQQPRQKLQAVPFAFMAKGLENGSISSSMIADGAIGLSKITGLGTAATANKTDFASVASPALTGVPTAPTADQGTNNSQIATTEFVLANIGAPANVIYAKSFGVKADGFSDDTVALQAAIDAAAAQASLSSRAIVILPRGIIRTRRTTAPDTVLDGEWKHSILLKNNVNIVGQGIDVTTIKMLDNAAGDTPVLLAKEPAANISLEGFTVSGNAVQRFGAVPQGEGECVNIKSGKNILMHKIKVIDAEQDGFDLDGGEYLRIINCLAEDCMGSGVHIVANGGRQVMISNSIFRRNGYVRRLAEGTGIAGSGSGIDCMMSGVVTGCLFENNAVEVQVFQGDVLMTGCVVLHTPSSLGLPGLVAGWTGLPAVASGVFDVRNCAISAHDSVKAIEIIQNWPDTAISGCRIVGKVVCTNGKNLNFNGNDVKELGGNNNALDVINATGKVQVTNNRFSNYVTGIRIDAALGGTVDGNGFEGSAAGVDLHFTAATGNTDNWTVRNNTFTSSATHAVRVGSGSSGGIYFGNTGDAGGFSMQIGAGGSASANRILNNQLINLVVDSAASTGNLIEGNTIAGTITHPSSTSIAGNTWRRNSGAACSGLFYGTATLVNGSATINSAAANSIRRFNFTRQQRNASTGIGALSVGTIVPQATFVIESLKANNTLEGGDQSSVYWEMVE